MSYVGKNQEYLNLTSLLMRTSKSHHDFPSPLPWITYFKMLDILLAISTT
jgi:hypothetical protein